jgi:hypothetical protein
MLREQIAQWIGRRRQREAEFRGPARHDEQVSVRRRERVTEQVVAG